MGTLYFIKEFQQGQRRWMTLGPGIGVCLAAALLVGIKIGRVEVDLNSLPKSLIWSAIQCAPAFSYFICKRILS
jgi:hypothetical protein